MLGNYLRTALRLLRRERGYAAINVGGLAVALAVCLVIGQFVAFQLSFDDSNRHGDRLHRVLCSDLEDPTTASVEQTAPLGPTLVTQLPGVEAAVRFYGGPWEYLMRAAEVEQGEYETGLLWADANVFDVFSFELEQGDPQTAPADGPGRSACASRWARTAASSCGSWWASRCCCARWPRRSPWRWPKRPSPCSHNWPGSR